MKAPESRTLTAKENSILILRPKGTRSSPFRKTSQQYPPRKRFYPYSNAQTPASSNIYTPAAILYLPLQLLAICFAAQASVCYLNLFSFGPPIKICALKEDDLRVHLAPGPVKGGSWLQIVYGTVREMRMLAASCMSAMGVRIVSSMKQVRGSERLEKS